MCSVKAMLMWTISAFKLSAKIFEDDLLQQFGGKQEESDESQLLDVWGMGFRDRRNDAFLSYFREGA